MRSSSDWRSNSLTDRSFLCKAVVVSTCMAFSFERNSSSSTLRISIFWMVLLLDEIAVVSISSMRTVIFFTSVSSAFFDIVQFLHLNGFLSQKAFKMLGIIGSFVCAIVSKFKFTCHILIIVLYKAKILFELGLYTGQVNVDVGNFCNFG